MKQTSLVLLLCTVLVAGKTLGQDEDVGGHEYSKMDPNDMKIDVHDDVADEKPLLGIPDGHEREIKETPESLNTAVQTERPLLGRTDGHELSQLLGIPDGHEAKDESLIGKPDGHDSRTEDEDTSENRYAYDEDNDYAYGDEEDPLVRCKHPLCDMYCPFGFQTDWSGCPACSCLDDPCQGVKCTDGNVCHPVECDDVHSCVKLSAKCIPPSRSCPEPMCANYCPNGYRNDEEGCMTCTCNVSPPQEVQDDHTACAEPMCANYCPGGYETNERGCHTCKCTTSETTSSCGGVSCDVGQICRAAESTSYCAPKPMCHIAQDMAYMARDSRVMAGVPRMFVPDCDENGSYKPMQCNQLVSECWCVDDRGKEIDGTRTPASSDDENQLHCEPNITVAVHIHMMLINIDGVYGDNANSYDENGEETDDDGEDEDNEDNLILKNEVLQHAIGSWLLVDQEFISITEVKQKSKTSISVHLNITSDGTVDLPSAVEHMKRRMRMGYCTIPLENSGTDRDVYLSPDVDTLNVEHHYSSDAGTQSTSSDGKMHSLGWYKRCFGNFRILLVVATMLLLFIVLALFAVLMVHRHRRNPRSSQYGHRLLENQLSHEQTKHEKGEVVIDALNESTVLVSADELEKKLAIA